jgi:pyruvate/2-oxoacid:ferredoxin oxidoreductase beta subunit/Pyruvate/2-oxoacid:ferredoxin oxidoreductase gamma subunit
MNRSFLSTDNLPFCRGCGHSLIARGIEKALQRLDHLDPLDLVVVTDIGCIGIIDKQFHAHTVHGLHGRSVALATGISMGLANPDKKILVLLGDGGATIGLHHIIEAAHRNIDMTVIVHNNMLYGMTGGQPSGLTPCGFRTSTMPEGRPDRGMDLCRMVHGVGAAYARRLVASGDITDALEEAFRIRGFSLVEAVELCPSYGVKFNPDRKPAEIAEAAGISPVVLRNESAAVCVTDFRENTDSLLISVPAPNPEFGHSLAGTMSVILAGSAGEGVQSTAELLALAAISCGLHVTKKGSYPVTVGVGFSLAEVIISTEEILYTGITDIGAALVTSLEGRDKARPRLEKMVSGTIHLDASLETPATGARVESRDYRTPLGPRSASLLCAAHFLKKTGFMPLEALLKAVSASRAGRAVDTDKLVEAVEKLESGVQ